MRKALSALGIVLLVLLAVLLIRTLLFTADQSIEADPFSVAVDEAQITAHMVEAIRFKTISTGNVDTQDYSPFSEFVEWVANTYPAVQEAMDLNLFGEHTMLYKWQGAQASLKPVLLTAHYDVVPVVPGSENNWQHPPFSGAIADGYVWGRGTWMTRVP